MQARKQVFLNFPENVESYVLLENTIEKVEMSRNFCVFRFSLLVEFKNGDFPEKGESSQQLENTIKKLENNSEFL